jgi:hypothetical protein
MANRWANRMSRLRKIWLRKVVDRNLVSHMFEWAHVAADFETIGDFWLSRSQLKTI